MMEWLRRRGRRLDEDLREEFASHIEMRAQLNAREGMAEGAARDSARRRFGNTALIYEETRRMHVSTLAETFLQDLRYAARGFIRSPIFALTAIFAAALGIGSATAVFSVVDRILFRALPYAHGEQLVSVGMMTPLDTNEFLFGDGYFDLRRTQTPFSSISSFVAGSSSCDLTETDPVRLDCMQFERSFLPMLGRAPLIGRNFSAQEDRPKGPRSALMSYALWRGRFGGDPSVVGRVISLDGQPITIAGVLPADFELPTAATADLYLPAQSNEATEHAGRAYRVFARLKPGVSIEQARAALEPEFERAIVSHVPAAFRKEVHLRIRSLRDRQTGSARLASWVLLAAVCAVLLIACANIANLLLARSTARHRELAVRAALGAGRVRLMRQALTEAALLGLTGGAAGLGVAWALLRLFISIAPAGILRLEEASLDHRVLLFAAVAAIVSALLFGLGPALRQPRAELLGGWRSRGAPRTIVREWLVAGQIAVSIVLLTGAGMLLRSLWKLEAAPLGLQTEHVIAAQVVLGQQGYNTADRTIGFYNDLEARVRQLPGVTSAAISDSLPPYGGERGRPFAALRVEGKPPFQQGFGGMVKWRYVTPGYLETLGIPMVRGRAFTYEDQSAGEQAVILSESLARKLFPNGGAIGGRLVIDGACTVVGIAQDTRDGGPFRPVEPEYYVVRRHTPDAVFRNQAAGGPGWRRAFISVRTPMDPRIMSEWIRREVAQLDPRLPVTIETMQQRVAKLAQRPRFNAFVLTLFAGVGVLLAMIGLYGVMAFLVGQRTAEIGVRMALGATPGAITKLILSRAALWTGIGIAGGIVGSLMMSRLLRTLLFEVPERDPWTYGAVVCLLIAIALGAAWIPSRRAARIEPMTALRCE